MAQIRLKHIGANVKPLQVIFTSSQTYSIPNGYRSADIFMVGGGGGGGMMWRLPSSSVPSGMTDMFAAGGGGGGGNTKTQTVSISSRSISVTIGSGGTCGGLKSYNGAGTAGTNGGDTSFVINETTYSASGGKAGTYAQGSHGISGGSGGSGGGASTYITASDYSWTTGNGGSNGSDGGNSIEYSVINDYGGKGQGTTTRAFGISSGTLYAGGGGGGGSKWFNTAGQWSPTPGTGGSGGGGGFTTDGNAYNGTNNTGGGGAGFGQDPSKKVNYTNNIGGNGGSGIAIIRLYPTSNRPSITWDSSNTINK